jgi:hypothetical protein
MDDDALKQLPREDGENKEDIIQRIKEAKLSLITKLCSNNLSLEIKKLIKVVFGVLLIMDQKHGP